jgi:hypothetical protein
VAPTVFRASKTAALTVVRTAAPGTAEQTAVPIVGPPVTEARTAAHSGTAEQTEVPTAAQTEVPTAAQTVEPTAAQTLAPGTMRSVLTGVLSTTATWPAPVELPDRKVDRTARRLRPGQVGPPGWLTAARMLEPTAAPTEAQMVEPTVAPRRATGLTVRPQIQTSIETISDGGLIPIDSTS